MQSSIGWWKLSPIHGCPLCASGIKHSFKTTTRFLVHSHISNSSSSSSSSKKFSIISKADSFFPSLSSQCKMDLTAQGCLHGTLAGSVVALGKFDALHIGHRALVEQASRMGPPALLSFTGMAQILGWEKRLPIVASCDRSRVTSLWSDHCSGVAPREFSLEFGKVRHLSPREFVQKLAEELQVKGVVAGENYRFGYKASGDSAQLKTLCKEFGLDVFIVQPVMDEFDQAPPAAAAIDGRDAGQVSSTRVRRALAQGNVTRVRELLGRKHRLIIPLDNATTDQQQHLLKLPLADSCNQFPAQGSYKCNVVFQRRNPVADTSAPSSCQVDVTDDLTLLWGVDDRDCSEGGYVSIEF